MADPAALMARRRRCREDLGPSVAGLIAAERLETRSMRVDEFDFELPESRIALKPASPRDAARLLHVEGPAFGDFTVADLPRLLRKGDILVLNDTKVIPAQLSGRRKARSVDGAVAIDVTLIRRLVGDPWLGARWQAFVRPAKRLRPGDSVEFSDAFRATVERRDGAAAILAFNLNGAEFDQALARDGAPPLPPYIARKRAVTPDDARAYQTVFAAEDGSVAAPTAGLHFTPQLFERLRPPALRPKRSPCTSAPALSCR